MIELKAVKEKAKLTIRFRNNKLYVKGDGNPQSIQLIQQLESKGANIKKGRGWYEVDIFKDHKSVNLGNIYINLEVDMEEEVARKLSGFYKTLLSAQGFKVEVGEI